MHTLLDLRGFVPAFTWITETRLSDVRILAALIAEPGRIYVSNHGFTGFARLHWLNEARAIYGTSVNAAKTQIWIPLSVCLLVAIARKRFGIEGDLYTSLQVLSTHFFEKTPLSQLLSAEGHTPNTGHTHNQLWLCDVYPGATEDVYAIVHMS